MHELSVATAVLGAALKHADERAVEVVAMRVGKLRQVVPDSLCFYWEIVTRETLCEDSRLQIEQIEVRLRCDDCACEWEPTIASFRCSDCGSAQVQVVAGQELEIEYLEIKESVSA